MAEVKDPVRTLRIASPIAVIVLSVLYILMNVSYFAVVPLTELADSGQIVAAYFFKYAFGTKSEKALDVIVALSALGNVLAVIFSQGRIVQQLGREDILPFSKFFGSSRPFGTPAAGLFEHWLACLVIILGPPPGDAYNFIVNLICYPLNIINIFVAAGLAILHYEKRQGKRNWNPPIRATLPVIIFFFLTNIYLTVAPFIPPSTGNSVYTSMPYYLHCVVAWGIFAAGFVYWLLWAKILPRIGNYSLKPVNELGDDGYWRRNLKKVPKRPVDAANSSSVSVGDSSTVKQIEPTV